DLHPGRNCGEEPTEWFGAPVRWPERCLESLAAGVDPVIVLARAAADEAIADARLMQEELTDPHCGCVFGTSKGGLHTANTLERLDTCNSDEKCTGERKRSPVAPHFLEIWPSNAVSELVSRFGITGPSLSPVAACATGLVAIIRAAELIRHGECDRVLTGSADYSLHPAVLASF